jgi:regulator of sirC expression with transglutaminase-like and TPR domain
MQAHDTIEGLEGLSGNQKAALVNLLSDEDPAVYRTIREKILSYGPQAASWLRPHTLSEDPLLRRRAQELVLHFDRQLADDAFLAFCLQHGENFDLEQSAWLFAQTRYPHINPEAYRALLDDFASDLRDRVDFSAKPKEILATLNTTLFSELGFTGNEENYYDPENSYLNRVIDRRTGNPINLSLLYILVARRLNLPVAGIGLPGHFICRYQSSAAEVYIDAFNHGKLLAKADCIQYLLQGNFAMREDYLTPLSPRRVLRRICGNLHQIYQKLGWADEVTRLQRYCIALDRAN